MSLSQELYSLPARAGVFLSLTVPAYLLTGLHYPDIADLNSFYTYLGYIMLYLLSSQLLATTLSNLLASRHIATIITGVVITCQALVSHYLIHSDDLSPWVKWIRFMSPQFWMGQPILDGELAGVKTFQCPHNPMITDDKTGIIKQVSYYLQSIFLLLTNQYSAGRLRSVQWKTSAGVLLPLLAQPLGGGVPLACRGDRRDPHVSPVPLPPLVLPLQTEPGQEEGQQRLLNIFLVQNCHRIVIVITALLNTRAVIVRSPSTLVGFDLLNCTTFCIDQLMEKTIASDTQLEL